MQCYIKDWMLQYRAGLNRTTK